jgi:hypothetical protein
MASKKTGQFRVTGLQIDVLGTGGAIDRETREMLWELAQEWLPAWLEDLAGGLPGGKEIWAYGPEGNGGSYRVALESVTGRKEAPGGFTKGKKARPHTGAGPSYPEPKGLRERVLERRRKGVAEEVAQLLETETDFMPEGEEPVPTRAGVGLPTFPGWAVPGVRLMPRVSTSSWQSTLRGWFVAKGPVTVTIQERNQWTVTADVEEGGENYSRAAVIDVRDLENFWEPVPPTAELQVGDRVRLKEGRTAKGSGRAAYPWWKGYVEVGSVTSSAMGLQVTVKASLEVGDPWNEGNVGLNWEGLPIEPRDWEVVSTSGFKVGDRVRLKNPVGQLGYLDGYPWWEGLVEVDSVKGVRVTVKASLQVGGTKRDPECRFWSGVLIEPKGWELVPPGSQGKGDSILPFWVQPGMSVVLKKGEPKPEYWPFKELGQVLKVVGLLPNGGVELKGPEGLPLNLHPEYVARSWEPVSPSHPDWLKPGVEVRLKEGGKVPSNTWVHPPPDQGMFFRRAKVVDVRGLLSLEVVLGPPAPYQSPRVCLELLDFLANWEPLPEEDFPEWAQVGKMIRMQREGKLPESVVLSGGPLALALLHSMAVLVKSHDETWGGKRYLIGWKEDYPQFKVRLEELSEWEPVPVKDCIPEWAKVGAWIRVKGGVDPRKYSENLLRVVDLLPDAVPPRLNGKWGMPERLKMLFPLELEDWEPVPEGYQFPEWIKPEARIRVRERGKWVGMKVLAVPVCPDGKACFRVRFYDGEERDVSLEEFQKGEWMAAPKPPTGLGSLPLPLPYWVNPGTVVRRKEGRRGSSVIGTRLATIHQVHLGEVSGVPQVTLHEKGGVSCVGSADLTLENFLADWEPVTILFKKEQLAMSCIGARLRLKAGAPIPWHKLAIKSSVVEVTSGRSVGYVTVKAAGQAKPFELDPETLYRDWELVLEAPPVDLPSWVKAGQWVRLKNSNASAIQIISVEGNRVMGKPGSDEATSELLNLWCEWEPVPDPEPFPSWVQKGLKVRLKRRPKVGDFNLATIVEVNNTPTDPYKPFLRLQWNHNHTSPGTFVVDRVAFEAGWELDPGDQFPDWVVAGAKIILPPGLRTDWMEKGVCAEVESVHNQVAPETPFLWAKSLQCPGGGRFALSLDHFSGWEQKAPNMLTMPEWVHPGAKVRVKRYGKVPSGTIFEHMLSAKIRDVVGMVAPEIHLEGPQPYQSQRVVVPIVEFLQNWEPAVPERKEVFPKWVKPGVGIRLKVEAKDGSEWRRARVIEIDANTTEPNPPYLRAQWVDGSGSTGVLTLSKAIFEAEWEQDLSTRVPEWMRPGAKVQKGADGPVVVVRWVKEHCGNPFVTLIQPAPVGRYFPEFQVSTTIGLYRLVEGAPSWLMRGVWVQKKEGAKRFEILSIKEQGVEIRENKEARPLFAKVDMLVDDWKEATPLLKLPSWVKPGALATLRLEWRRKEPYRHWDDGMLEIKNTTDEWATIELADHGMGETSIPLSHLLYRWEPLVPLVEARRLASEEDLDDPVAMVRKQLKEEVIGGIGLVRQELKEMRFSLNSRIVGLEKLVPRMRLVAKKAKPVNKGKPIRKAKKRLKGKPRKGTSQAVTDWSE